jgi:pimeloyl-ACP methyl ester carboxylesterase
MCLQNDHFRVRVVFWAIAIGLFVLLLEVPAWAQPAAPPAKEAPPAKAPDDRAPAAKPKGPPEPEHVWLETKDGWKIHCTYYGPQEGIRKGSDPGKETVPIIMVHGWGGQGSDYSILAEGLQTYGHASIVPDLRGHGRSTSRKLPDGNIKIIKHDDARKFGPLEKDNMYLDIEACKKFLMEKNNDKEVNIEMLCVVGAEAGTIVAANWAAVDWNWPIMPAFKQGQDVKALVLLSPRQTFERMNATKALAHPAIAQKLSILIAVGQNDRRAYGDAKRIHSRLERVRPTPPKDRIEKLRKQDLFFVTAQTNLQGTKLLNRALPINRNIAGFIDLRLVKKREDLLWAERKNPIGGN